MRLVVLQHLRGGNLLLRVLATCALVCFVGCSPVRLAHNNLFKSRSIFPPTLDAKESCRTYRSWANGEWNELAGHGGQFSLEYERGFKTGFVDTVFAGGSGEPPQSPPERFWRINYRSTRGDRLIADWTTGFRHGAQVALQKGYRDRALIPVTQMLESSGFLYASETSIPSELNSAMVDSNYVRALDPMNEATRSSEDLDLPFPNVIPGPSEPLP